MALQVKSKNIKYTITKKQKTKTSNDRSDYDDHNDYFCDNCMSTYCRCDDIDKEAGFIRDYETKNEESMGKYVCKYCYKLPLKCKCM